MDPKSMELKVMYCKDLKAFNFFQKLLVYVLVSIVSDDPDKKLKQNQQQRTPTDIEEDGNPEWNHEMQFDLSDVSFVDCDNLFIHFDLRHEGLYFGDKTIGEVRVPLKDLIQESSGILRFVSYQVQTPDGKPNGVLNFSCKVLVKGKEMGIHSPVNEITGYSIIHHHHHQSPEIHNPTSEVQISSPKIHYPFLELEDNYQVTQISYSSHGTEYSSQESHSPPAPNVYYPPSLPLSLPPPPPPPLMHRPPPPPPYGACCHPPYPPGFHNWMPSEVYDYSMHENWNPTDGQSHSFGNGEKRRNEFQAYWNGR